LVLTSVMSSDDLSKRTKKRRINQRVEERLALVESSLNVSRVRDTNSYNDLDSFPSNSNQMVYSLEDQDIDSPEFEELGQDELDNVNVNCFVDVAIDMSASTLTSTTACETSSDSHIRREESVNNCFDLDAFGNQCESDEESFSSKSESDIGIGEDESHLNSHLAKWASGNNISMVALGSLLLILRPFHPSLPKDPRTLLNTPRNFNTDIKSIAGGKYFHFGIMDSVTHVLKKGLLNCLDGIQEIWLQISIDGLPLFKSSNDQFWPILGKIVLPFKTSPFIIGLFSGKNKPENVSEYLNDFTQEMRVLEDEPVHLDTYSFLIKIQCFVCDAPARSFLKRVKGHTGYHGCEKCKQKGEWRNKMTFPLVDAEKRTDEDIGHDHQIGVSLLQTLAIGLVSQFPYEPMHMVFQGVMKRLMFYWFKSPVSKGLRIGPRPIQQISENLVSFQDFIPREFARKCRALSEMDRWKATEFRQFLIYSGIVALKGHLSLEHYNHFLMLYVAIFSLSSPDFFQDHADYAHELLCIFVRQCEILYDKEFVVYNVHGLVHLAEDVKRYGPLDAYSAFPFESYLKQLKQLVHKPQSTLEQVVKRLLEKRNLDVPVQKQKQNLKFDVPLKKHVNGHVPPLFQGYSQFEQVNCKKFFLSRRKGDNCVKICGAFFLIRNILSSGDSIEVILVVERFSKVCDFFEKPVKSSYLDIHLASDLKGNFETFHISQVEKELVLLPYKNMQVLIPFCHE